MRFVVAFVLLMISAVNLFLTITTEYISTFHPTVASLLFSVATANLSLATYRRRQTQRSEKPNT
jgi:hypothetical protein